MQSLLIIETVFFLHTGCKEILDFTFNIMEVITKGKIDINWVKNIFFAFSFKI